MRTNISTRCRLTSWVQLHFILIFLVVSSDIANAGISSQITKKLDDISQTLTKVTLAKKPATEKIPLAVLTFSTAKDLEKKRVGFAVAELLLHHFIKVPGFTLVERAELQNVLQEQKLQLTGALDPETAVKIGQLIGAKMLVLGSVEKLAGEYIVHARTVEVETGEVLATAYEEMPSRLFEEQASQYLVLVPESQAIGFYGFFNYRKNSNSVPTTQSMLTEFNSTTTMSYSPNSFNLNVYGGGIRYFATPHIMVDISVGTGRVMSSGRMDTNHSVTDLTTNITQDSKYTSITGFSAYLVRGIVTRVIAPGNKIRYFMGGGVSYYTFHGFAYIPSLKTTVPAAAIGLEYKIQSRLTLGLFANYDYIKNVPTYTDFNSKKQQALKLNNLSFSSTLALYF